MTFPAPPRIPETALRKEGRILREQIRRLANCSLNKIFELTDKGSKRRSRMLFIILIALGFLISLRAHPLGDWGAELSRLFAFFFVRDYAALAPNTLANFIGFVRNAFFGPETLRYLPVIILPFILAWQAAATYLDDIFEINRIDIARDFIMQVALTGNRKSIRIGGGEVAAADKESPIYLIGGPGQVLVELDSAALFEKPDGRPRVIGPTVKGKATLEGFERFRQAVDLRDQYPDSLEVDSRSLDGIRVSAADVRMLFSIWRDGQSPSAETPHPFSPKAVESLVYDQVSRVIVDGPFPSEPPVSWTGTSLSLIRGELGGFMSMRRLVEYLASIGPNEIQQARQRENEILAVGNNVIADGDSLEPRQVPPPPEFQARNKISSLFSQFTKDFTEKASKRGVELHWVGVGTWKTPNEIVPGKHLEAWRISRENIARGNPTALDILRQEARLQQIIRLIQTAPLERFNQTSGDEHQHRVKDLLIAYRQQLIEAVELLRKSKKPIPTSIPRAIERIGNVIAHWL